MKRSPEGIAV